MFRIIYIGSDNFSANVLTELAGFGGCAIAAVATYPDMPHGRGHKLIPTPVKIAAQNLGIDVIEIADVADTETHKKLAGFDVPVALIVSFKLVPPEFIKIFPKGIINLHPSLLPDLRGAAPVQWAIMHGYSRSGMTAFIIDRETDTGNMLMQRSFDIGENETTDDIYDKIVHPGAELLFKSADSYLSGGIEPGIQVGLIQHKAPRIKRKHCLIRWEWSALKIHNRIRALTPNPGASAAFAGKNVKILSSLCVDNYTGKEPGSIIESDGDKILVATGDGVVAILEIQPEGKPVLKAEQFAAGYFKKAEKFEGVHE